MIKLCFDDGNEYELIAINTPTFCILTEKAYPNFTPVRANNQTIYTANGVGLTEFTYQAVKLGFNYYATKLINKDKHE